MNKEKRAVALSDISTAPETLRSQRNRFHFPQFFDALPKLPSEPELTPVPTVRPTAMQTRLHASPPSGRIQREDFRIKGYLFKHSHLPFSDEFGVVDLDSEPTKSERDRVMAVDPKYKRALAVGPERDLHLMNYKPKREKHIKGPHWMFAELGLGMT